MGTSDENDKFRRIISEVSTPRATLLVASPPVPRSNGREGQGGLWDAIADVITRVESIQTLKHLPTKS